MSLKADSVPWFLKHWLKGSGSTMIEMVAWVWQSKWHWWTDTLWCRTHRRRHRACQSVLGAWGRWITLPQASLGICLPFSWGPACLWYAWWSWKLWDSTVTASKQMELSHTAFVMAELFSATFLWLLLPFTASEGCCDTWLDVLLKRQTPKGCRF